MTIFETKSQRRDRQRREAAIAWEEERLAEQKRRVENPTLEERVEDIEDALRELNPGRKFNGY